MNLAHKAGGITARFGLDLRDDLRASLVGGQTRDALELGAGSGSIGLERQAFVVCGLLQAGQLGLLPLELLALPLRRRGGAFGFAQPRLDLGLVGLDLDAEESAAGDEEPDGVVVEAARVAQLHTAIEGFPNGWGTLLGERGVNLSGGQKQRTTLARAVARDPRILVLDDALSAVDTHTEARILDDLAHVMEGRTSFIISHRVSAVMNADLILVLDGGRIVERGRHPDLIAIGGTYARLLHRQMLEQDIEATVVEAAGD